MRKTFVFGLAILGALLGTAALLYARNDAPLVPAIASADAAAPGPGLRRRCAADTDVEAAIEEIFFVLHEPEFDERGHGLA